VRNDALLYSSYVDLALLPHKYDWARYVAVATELRAFRVDGLLMSVERCELGAVAHSYPLELHNFWV
jgi:hypothetical protein